jgi:hypothetical protein
MPDWIASVIFGVAVMGVFVFFVIKKKNDEWEGELFKKRYSPGDMETSESYTLVFKTKEGKKKRFNVNAIEYKKWDEGDKAKKEKGKYQPTKID